MHRGERLHREIRMHGFGAVGREDRDVVDLAGRAGLDDEAGRRAQPVADEMLMDRRGGEQHRDRDMLSRRSSGPTRSGC